MAAFRRDIMKEEQTRKKDIIETTVYCLNTKRMYIYQLRGGEIVGERVVQCTE
jgi:hypothetical protein